MNDDTRTCTKCGMTLPIVEFYRTSKKSAMLFAACKDCTRAAVRLNYHNNIEEKHAYERNRNKTPERRAYLQRQMRLHRARHPDRTRARTAVGNALRDGRIVRPPCEICGTTEKVQAHHEDYSKPLDVRWMCFRCHREHAHGQHPT